MILEELIYFERKQLKATDSLDLQLLQIHQFLSGFPPVSIEKLKFFLVLLKERQAEEKPYEGLGPIKLTFAFLALMLIGSVLAFKGLSPFADIRNELLLSTLILFVLWMTMAVSLIRSRKRLKYQLLIRVLECHIAMVEAS